MNPVYIACANSKSAQVDCGVQRFGSLVRLTGHSEMDFTGRDAYALAKAILAAVDPLDRPLPSVEENASKTGLVGAQKARPLIFSREMLMHYRCSACDGWWSIGDGRSYSGYLCPHCGKWLEIAT